MTVSLRVTHHTALLNGITQHWVTAGGGPARWAHRVFRWFERASAEPDFELAPT
ncbi:MAG: hypothetical protein ABR880_22665 [Candidatus Sulfotelmatobacter sp.]|jgi:hypothetical protein